MNADEMDQRVEQHEDLSQSSIIKWFALMILWLRAKFNLPNKAVSYLLMVISGFLSVIAQPFHALFPSTMYSLTKLCSTNKSMRSYARVVCPSITCNATYEFADSFYTRNGKVTPNLYSARLFKRTCNEPLLFKKTLSNEKTTLVPFKNFLFKPPSQWLSEMFQFSEFRQMLNARFKHSPGEGMEDIWDGSVWKEFLQDPNDGSDLLSAPYNIAFMLFVDWMAPFKRGNYSYGTIFMSVLDLPRKVRLTKRWMNAVGIIPGSKEPKIHMNTYLKPLVNDLLHLWNGKEIEIASTKQKIHVRAMLFCVSCNLPALRKVTQFLSHRANRGLPNF